MFKNPKLEELYHIASQKDVTHHIDYYRFALEPIENLTADEIKLLELITNMYSEVPCVSEGASDLFLDVAQYNILNIQEILQILTPYETLMTNGKQLEQPLSFLIQHKISAKELTKEQANQRQRFCTLTILLVQLSSNLTLTNEHKQFCIHSSVFDNLIENSPRPNTDYIETIQIDLSQCETAKVGYLCDHWLYTECKKGRIIPNPVLKRLVEYFYGPLED